MRKKKRTHQMPVIVKMSMIIFAISLMMPIFNFSIYGKLAPKETMNGVTTVNLWKQFTYTPKELSEKFSKDWMQDKKISKENIAFLKEKQIFAMFLDETGEIVWQERVPKSLQKKYTIQEVAKLSRYYYHDYPTFTWEAGKELLVLGYPKDSIWKYQIIYPIQELQVFFSWLVFTVLVDFLIIVFLGFCMEWIHQKKMKKRDKTDEARAEWIRFISHDIRTPLTLILGYADSLSEEDGISTNGKREAQMVKAQAMRIKELVADLNLTTKLEYQMQSFYWEKFRIAPMLRELLSELVNEGLLDHHPIDLEVEQEVENYYIEGDKKLISRAIYNLVQNSVKHNPSGCEIKIFCRKKKKWLQIVVEDDGEKEVDIKALPHARGLGLRIVFQVVKVHRGKLIFTKANPHGFRTELYFLKAKEKGRFL